MGLDRGKVASGSWWCLGYIEFRITSCINILPEKLLFRDKFFYSDYHYMLAIYLFILHVKENSHMHCIGIEDAKHINRRLYVMKIYICSL